ncbi:MAG: hypothetical protein KDD61_00810 [Bdellovibrionales bacterium]|nr:hypothetical protein [Bdellovibrionales bacterium]
MEVFTLLIMTILFGITSVVGLVYLLIMGLPLAFLLFSPLLIFYSAKESRDENHTSQNHGPPKLTPLPALQPHPIPLPMPSMRATRSS